MSLQLVCIRLFHYSDNLINNTFFLKAVRETNASMKYLFMVESNPSASFLMLTRESTLKTSLKRALQTPLSGSVTFITAKTKQKHLFRGIFKSYPVMEQNRRH